jgi:dTDP-4-dehydrorhamnose reductase
MHRSIPSNKVLVLGDGLLGSEIVRQTGWDCVSRKKDGLNIIDYHSLIDIVINYNIVINCIANTNSYSEDKKAHFETNYYFAALLADITNTEGIKLVHISTEFVYANNPTIPTEEYLPQPDTTWYAYTKLLADEYIQLNHSNHLICRELHKPNPFPYDKVWKVQTSGDTVDKIAELIIKLINTNAKGVFNVGTGDKWLKELAPNAEEIEAPIHVPKDTRMNLDKLNKWLENQI